MVRMQSAVLSLFCIGKSTGDISEFVLRGHFEITVKIRLVGQYWTYKKGSSRLQSSLAGLELTAPKSFLIGSQFTTGDLLPGRRIPKAQ